MCRTLHITVKLKARLLKPSTVLPLGSFVAGAHHIKVIQSSNSKGEHGLRDKDLNHKDRQNFEAVNCITSTSVISLLDKMPDALGTIAYLRMTKDVSESFLDTKLHPLDRIEKIWCAVFFLRYWRQYVVDNKAYTLQNNFITYNAYMCIELNAHSLLTFLLFLKVSDADKSFTPWLLGSQC